MRITPRKLLGAIVLTAALPALAATPHRPVPAKHAPGKAARTAASLHRSGAKRGKGKAALTQKNPHGHLAQIAMDPERATQIQQALIKQGYLTGEPTGRWDTASVTAMQKLQADNGWQTKIMPDSRALIKLGLGPASSAASGPTEASATGPVQ